MPTKITLKTEGIEKAIKAFRDAGNHKARVGILATTDSRMGADNSNATIGAIHEFGDATHPVRSFLRVPLKENLDRYLEKAGAFQQENFKQVIQDVSIVSWLSKVGQVAVNVVQDAFASAGFGKWKAWKNKSYTNNTGMILVDTQALRDSITYDVK